jgi:YHS domain-containing protein/TusA-related sulfurtransferase
MNKNMRSIMIMAALAFVLVIAAVGQQKSGDTAIDPVCGMTVVKATAKATFEYKGTAYYFCSTGCKEAFAKDPGKYLKAEAKGEEKAAPMGMMHGQHMGQELKVVEGVPLEGCPMMARPMPMRGRMGRMGMMHGGKGHGMMGEMPMGMCGGMGKGMGMTCGQNCPLHGADVEMTVEKTKDGVTLKVTSKNAETVKAIQEHMTEHVAMMKKMKEEAGKADKAPEGACCPNCQMKKDVIK